MAPTVKHPTLAQVMILWPVGSSPASGAVLTAQSLEPALDSGSPSLSAPPPFVLVRALSLSQIRKYEKKRDCVSFFMSSNLGWPCDPHQTRERGGSDVV